MAVAPFFVPSFNSFFFWGTGGFIWFFIFFFGVRRRMASHLASFKEEKNGSRFFTEFKKKNNGYSYVSIWNNQINRSIQSIGKFDWKKKLALKSRVTACKSAKKKRKKLLDDNNKKKKKRTPLPWNYAN